MPDLHLHIISFDIPFPANYGGVIDVFYKIRALHAAGVKIHLHCFEYHREPAPELKSYCESVNYYPRKTAFVHALSWKPYIVFSRRSESLLANLCRDNHPILFEGLHSCYYLSHPSLQNRIRIYRESNIEHHYYFHLSKAENNIVKKIYFLLSGLKLRSFQRILAHSSVMITVSREDQQYLSVRFPRNRVEYIPSFHRENDVSILPGKGDFALYHGNLGVGENIRAAEYLVREVFSGSGIKLVIAGQNPPRSLAKLADKSPGVTLVENPSDDEMFRLIREAHINVLITFQATGLKLKLLNALFNGRFCLVNPEMIAGTEVGSLCRIGKTKEELKREIGSLMRESFTGEQIIERRERLLKWHSNDVNCRTLLNLISLLEHPSS